MNNDTHDRSNPFPGLRPFQSDEGHLFFGRGGQSDELLRRLRRNRFLAVVGTSGSGKSSLVRAGLLPSLYGGHMTQAGATWRVAVFRPGNDPLGKLARALNDKAVLGDPAGDEEDLRAQAIITEATLRRGALGLVTAVQQARLPKGENLLIVVDQFEELFRFKRAGKTENAEDEAAAFVKLLLEVTRHHDLPVYVIITMRSDFLGDCSQFRDLPEAINDGQYLIPRMTRDQRREAITGPVAVGGAAIAPRLVNWLLNDVGDNPDQLPILQHALMRTWDHWKAAQAGDGAPPPPLDLEHYEAVGGMADALSRHADEAYLELSAGDGSRDIAESLFKSLTERGPDNREIRRPTALREIAEVAGASEVEVVRVIETFRRLGRSFLMPPPGTPLYPDSLIDISHESLIRGWERLRKWTDEEAESAKIYRRLSETVDLRREGKAGLWRDPDLAIALNWREENRPNQSWADRYDPDFEEAMQFLADSRAARDAEIASRQLAQRREVRRTRVFSVVITAAFLTSVAFGVSALRARGEALLHAQAANAARVEAESHRLVALKRAEEAEAAREAATNSEKEAVRERERAEEHARIAEEKRRQAEAAREAERVALKAAKSAEAKAVRNAALAAESETKWRDEALEFRSQKFNDSASISSMAGRLAQLAPLEEAVHWRNVKADALTNMGDHEAAAGELTESLKDQPHNFRARSLRGYMYMLLGRGAESVADLRAAVKEKPNSSLEHLNLGVSLGLTGDYDDARRHIEQAITNHVPGENATLVDNEVSPDIQKVTGRTILLSTGEEFFDALHYQLANIEAFRGGNFGAALERARAGARGGATKITYLTALNWAWLQGTHRADDYGSRAAQAATWEQAGYKQLAVRDYAEFLRQHSKASGEAAQAGRVARYAALTRWVESRLHALDPKGDLRRASEANNADDQRSARALSVEALERMNRGDLQTAELLIERAVHIEPDNINLLLQRASLRFDKGESEPSVDDKEKSYKAARDDANAVLGQSPLNPDAIMLRAKVNNRLMMAGRDDPEATRERVEADLRRVLERDPLHGEALAFLAAIIEAERPREALNFFKRSLMVYPYTAWVYKDMAALHNALGEREEALKAIQTALALRRGSSGSSDFSDFEAMKDYLSLMEEIEPGEAEVDGLRRKAERALQLGDLALGQNRVQAAYKQFDAAEENLRRAAETSAGQTYLQRTLACEQLLTRRRMTRTLALGRTMKIPESFAGKVIRVAPGQGNDREVTVGRGSLDGMVGPGTQVGVHSIPGAGERTTQSRASIGTGVVLRVGPDSTTVRVTLNDPKGDGLVRVGDVVLYDVEVPALPPRTALQKLAGLEISLADKNDKPFFDHRGLGPGETPEMRKGILAAMVADIHDAARDDEQSAELGKKIGGGRFKGLTVGEAMAKSGPDDVAAFLDFAAANTHILLGRDLSLAYAYGIWLSYNAPEAN